MPILTDMWTLGQKVLEVFIILGICGFGSTGICIGLWEENDQLKDENEILKKKLEKYIEKEQIEKLSK